MAIDHALTMASASNLPDPTGTPADSGLPNPTPDNLWTCSYPCTVSGHTDTVVLLWDGSGFTLPDFEANDNDYGAVVFTYVPPIV